jgi:hypothetical protein
MAATIEKVVGAGRSRLAKIDEGIAADEAKVEAARRKLVELAAAEDAAVAEVKRKDPLANPYKLREPAQELRAEREKLERSLDGLEKGLAVLKSDRVAAAAEQAARELAERTAEARDLVQRWREARLAAGKAFAALVERWNALAEVLERKSALVLTVAGEQLVDRVGVFNHEVLEKWAQVAGFAVTPVPVDLRGVLEEAIEASTGERPGEEQAGLAEMNRHRATLGLAAETRPVSASARELAEAYPDLRGEIRTAQVNGAEIRRSAEPELPWPGEAA